MVGACNDFDSHGRGRAARSLGSFFSLPPAVIITFATSPSARHSAHVTNGTVQSRNLMSASVVLRSAQEPEVWPTVVLVNLFLTMHTRIMKRLYSYTNFRLDLLASVGPLHQPLRSAYLLSCLSLCALSPFVLVRAERLALADERDVTAGEELELLGVATVHCESQSLQRHIFTSASVACPGIDSSGRTCVPQSRAFLVGPTLHAPALPHPPSAAGLSPVNR